MIRTLYVPVVRNPYCIYASSQRTRLNVRDVRAMDGDLIYLMRDFNLDSGILMKTTVTVVHLIICSQY